MKEQKHDGLYVVRARKGKKTQRHRMKSRAKQRGKGSKSKGTWEKSKQSKCDARVPATDGTGDI